MSSLTVNVDMVAALRQIRGLTEPDPAQAVVLAELAGADGIAIQLRRNRRHIRDRDLYLLKGVVKTRLTLEMPPIKEMIEKAREVKPWMVTLVADYADADSSVQPLDLRTADLDFGVVVAEFRGLGIHSGFFVEPDTDQIKSVAKSGASAVLINCSGYTEARTFDEAQSELDRIERSAAAAAKAGLAVHCGRGLNYKNVGLLTDLGLMDEFVVGFSICSRAMLVGMDRAVTEMLRMVRPMPGQD